MSSNKIATKATGVIAAMGLLAAMGAAPDPTQAWAATAGSGNATAETASASIGSEYYASITDAIAAAEDGDTVTLAKDEVAPTYIGLDKSITLDLAGHTLSRTTGNCLFNPTAGTLTVKDSAGGGKLSAEIPIWPENGASFVLVSGSIGGSWAAINAENAGSITIKGGTVTAESYAINSTGATPITISGGELTATGTSAFTIALLGTGGSLTMSGGAVKATGSDSVGISDNGNNGNTDITITGGTVESAKDIAVYKPGPGTLSITGGTITGGTGVYVKSGKISVPSDSKVIITDNGDKVAYTPARNGAVSTGDAVVIENAGYPGGDPEVAIDGGIFISTNGTAVASYAPDSREPEAVFIEGGVFSDQVEATLVEKDGYILAQLTDGEHKGMWRLVPADISKWSPKVFSGSHVFDGQGHPDADEVPLVLEYTSFDDGSGDVAGLTPREVGSAEDGYSIAWADSDGKAADSPFIDAGEYSAIATGTGKFKGAVKIASYKIEPADISSATVEGVEDVDWAGKAVEPKPVVKLGDKVLVEGADYKLSYSSNEAPGVALVTVEGIGNYTGSAFKSFIILGVETPSSAAMESPQGGEETPSD